MVIKHRSTLEIISLKNSYSFEKIKLCLDKEKEELSVCHSYQNGRRTCTQ